MGVVTASKMADSSVEGVVATEGFDITTISGRASVLDAAYSDLTFPPQSYDRLRDLLLSQAQGDISESERTELEQHMQRLRGEAATPPKQQAEVADFSTKNTDVYKHKIKGLPDADELPKQVGGTLEGKTDEESNKSLPTTPSALGITRPTPSFISGANKETVAEASEEKQPSRDTLSEDSKEVVEPPEEHTGLKSEEKSEEEVVTQQASGASAEVHGLATDQSSVLTPGSELPSQNIEVSKENELSREESESAIEPLSHEEHAQRISDIKAEVAEYFPNPVALLDTAEGRDYNQALLCALRVTPAQSNEDHAETLQKLEVAKASLLNTHSSDVETAGIETSDIETFEPNVASADGVPCAPEDGGEEDTTLHFKDVKKAVFNDDDPVSRSSDESNVVEQQTEGKAIVEKDEHQPTIEQLGKELADPGTNTGIEGVVLPEPVSEAVGDEAAVPESGLTEEPDTETEVSAKQPTVEHLVAETTEPEAASSEYAKPVIEATEPYLQSAGVTEGLTQLLGEWKLFSSSGLLGTGPGGLEHPVYKKLSQLPMRDVLSDKCSKEAGKGKDMSIENYIASWKNEQGITHDPNETFDRFLRRVVAHVLESQQGAQEVE